MSRLIAPRPAPACALHRGRRLATAATLLLAAAFTMPSLPAAAADLSGAPYDERYASPYDDPRYADIYRHPPRIDDDDDRFEQRSQDDDPDDDYDDAPPPRRYGERRDEYLPPMRGGPRFDDRRHAADEGCVPRHVVKRRLRAAGWSDFHDLELQGGLAFVRARRPSGRLFALEVHRCSGEIVSARPYGPRTYGYGTRRYHPSRT